MDQNGVSIITQPNQMENSIQNFKRIPSTNGIHHEATKFELPRLKKLMEEDVTLSIILKKSLAEFIGTAILIFLGCMGCVGSLGHVPSPIQVSFTFGLTVLLIIQSIGHISDAHVNPAITVGAVILGKKSLPMAVIYIVSQVAGATIGFGLLKAVTPETLLHSGDLASISQFCITDLHNDISVTQGLVIEIIATGILMFMASAVWDSRNAIYGDSVAIKFGLAVTTICMAVGPYTGCSMNPARSLGPALWNNSWNNHWIFWLGPIAGSIISSVLYRSIFWPQES